MQFILRFFMHHTDLILIHVLHHELFKSKRILSGKIITCLQIISNTAGSFGVQGV